MVKPVVTLLAFSLSLFGASSLCAREAEQVAEIQIFIRNQWFLDFRPDGSVHIGYGSLPTDSASLPKGTVDFEALHKAVQRLTLTTSARETHVAVLRKGERTTRSFGLSDDTLFRYLVDSWSDKWEPSPLGNRFAELLTKYPIYSD